MDSPTNAAPNASVDNELHRDSAEDAYDFYGYLEEEAARTAAATLRRLANNNSNTRTRPRTLDSPFRTPSPASSKRSYDSMDDDTTPTPTRPSQRARHDDQPRSPFQENADMHQQRQAVTLPPIVEDQEQEPEAAAAPLLPSFDALLQGAGLTREVDVAPRLQSPFPLLQQYCRLPSPNLGQEHFAFEFHHPRPIRLLLQPHHPPEELGDRLLLPPPALGGEPGPHAQLDVDFPPRYAHHENGDYYHHNAGQEQLPPPLPPPRQTFPWVHYNDLSDGHWEAYEAACDWEDLAQDTREQLDGMIERARARARLGGFEDA
jgi:hypothetical protein